MAETNSLPGGSKRKRSAKGHTAWVKQILVQSKFQAYHSHMLKMLENFREDNERPLHPYQIETVLKIREMVLADMDEKNIKKKVKNEDTSEPNHSKHTDVSTAKPVVVVAPTGAGKSGIIMLTPYVLQSSKVLIITPSICIKEQLADTFGYRLNKKSFFEEIELFDEGDTEVLQERVSVINNPRDILTKLANVVIVNAQKFGGKSKLTLSLLYKKEEMVANVETFFRQFDTLIVDEAHHYPAKTWENIVEEFRKPVPDKNKKMVFVTATPCKGNGKEKQFILGPEMENRIAFKVTEEMTLGVATRPCKFVEIKHDATYENIYKDVIDLLNPKLQDGATNKKPETRFVSQAMILVRRRVDATHLVDFLNAQYKRDKPEDCSYFAVATLGGDETALNEFKAGNHRVAVTCGVGSEGFNNPSVTICVILRSVRSRILFSQFVGRCMRLKMNLPGNEPDKTTATVLSYSKFEQQKMWLERERLAEEDPHDSGEED